MRVAVAIALTAGVIAGGCAVEPKLKTADIRYYSQHEPLTIETATVPVGIDASDGMCIRIVDARSRTVAEGWSFPRDQVRDWLVEGLQSRLGVVAEYTEEAPESGGYLSLDRLYIKHIATTMAGVTVLRAHGSETSRAVRGNMTRMNWNGTSREFSRVLSQSLDDAIAKLPLPAIVNRNCGLGAGGVELAGTP